MLTEEQVSDLRDVVYENQPSQLRGMSYEQGVADALDVVLGREDLQEFVDELPEFAPDDEY